MEEGGFTGGFVEVERLRIVLLAKLFDLLCGDVIAGDGIELLADVEVLEVKRLLFACGSSS